MPFPGWTAAPRDALQAIVANSPAHDFWVGGIVRGDGTATPAISQIRVEYGPDTFLKYLPALYRKDPASRSVLERFLSLAQSELGDLGLEIGDLPLLFDPAAAPAGGFPSWLTWLSGWLAWIVNHNWSEKQAREYLAGAFSLYGWRGTPSGLRRYLKIYAGVNAHIFEPSQTATLWSLGENSSLGFTTMLAPAEAEGAVLGSTAVLDHSDLQSPGDCFGGALFDDIAYRFCVGIYCAELTRPGALRDARAAIAREKPAHTVCYLCLIEPRMRIGVQSRIGIDAIVGAAPPAILGEQLGFSVLAATDRARTESEVRNG
jgi:phage tail-like protein